MPQRRGPKTAFKCKGTSEPSPLASLTKPNYHIHGASECKVPERKAPECKATERKAPECKAPENKAPECKATERKAPERKAPECKATERKAPEHKAPECKAPERKAPKCKAPECKAPERRAPERKAPECNSLENNTLEPEAPQRKAPDCQPDCGIVPVRKAPGSHKLEGKVPEHKPGCSTTIPVRKACKVAERKAPEHMTPECTAAVRPIVALQASPLRPMPASQSSRAFRRPSSSVPRQPLLPTAISAGSLSRQGWVESFSGARAHTMGRPQMPIQSTPMPQLKRAMSGVESSGMPRIVMEGSVATGWAGGGGVALAPAMLTGTLPEEHWEHSGIVEAFELA